MDRAYSTFRVKSVQEDERVIFGLASTPSLDRDGDEVLPSGAEFELPLPLLWAHDMKAPVGHVTHASVTARGIEVRAQFAKIDEPGKLKDRLDEAWQSVKHGLVRGLSVGFRGLDSEVIPRTGGRRFKRWSWLELSCVVVPSNVQASVLAIKAADVAARTGERPRFAFEDFIRNAHTPAIPQPFTAPSLKGMSGEQLAEAVFKAAQGYIAQRLAPMDARIKALEERS